MFVSLLLLLLPTALALDYRKGILPPKAHSPSPPSSRSPQPWLPPVPPQWAPTPRSPPTTPPAPGTPGGPPFNGFAPPGCRPGMPCNVNPRCQYQSYTALGDSYSAGLNYVSGLLPDCSAGSAAPCNGGSVCLRNSDAFPILMQNAHNFSSFQFLACSGANTTECDQTQVQSSSYGRPDLVSITIGGDNNQAFLGLIVNCVYQRDETACQYAIANAQQTIQGIGPYLNSLFTDILTTNPNPWRKVVVVGYPQLWSTTNGTSCQSPTLAAVPAADRQSMNTLALQIDSALRSAAQQFGFAYADADPLFEGNRLCDNTPTPYFQYDFPTALYGVFHPTAVGQQLLFTALNAASGCAGAQ